MRLLAPSEMMMMKVTENITLQKEGRVQYFASVEASRFDSVPKLENFLNYNVKIILEIA